MSFLSALFIPQNNIALSFGLLIAASAALCIVSACILIRKLGGSTHEMMICSVSGLVFGAVFSHIYHVFAASSSPDISLMANLGSGGFSLLGMLVGFTLGVFFCALSIGANAGRLLDAAAPALSAGISLGMLGCIFSGEYFGSAVSSNALAFFPFAVYSKAEGIWRTPLFWYMSVYCAVLCAFLLILIHRAYTAKTLYCISGEIFALFAALYCSPAGIMETFRCDSMLLSPVFLNKFHTIQTNQFCFGIFAGTAVLYLIVRRAMHCRFALRSLWALPVAALMYCGYYYDMLHIATVYDWLNTLWKIISAAGLAAIALYTFFALCRERAKTK